MFQCVWVAVGSRNGPTTLTNAHQALYFEQTAAGNALLLMFFV